MKNTKTVSTKWLSHLAPQICMICAIALAVVIGFSMVSCLEEGDSYISGFSTIEAFNEWLSKQQKNTPDNPYRVKLNISKDLYMHHLYPLSHPENRGKYVDLDISGSTIARIEDGTFSTCGTLVGITIGDSVKSIGKEAFNYSGLRRIIIGNGVTSIGEKAFNHNYKLTSLTFGNSVTSIGEEAFDFCDSLTELTIPDSVKTIGVNAFSLCENITSLTLGNGVTNIEFGAFQQCNGLTSVYIPDNVITLSGFIECANLSSVTIGKGVTSIVDGAFQGCENLTSITIPSNVQSITNGSFNNSSSYPVKIIGLIRVTFEGNIPTSGFVSGNYMNTTPFNGDLQTKYLAGGIGTYTRANNSSSTWTKQY